MSPQKKTLVIKCARVAPNEKGYRFTTENKRLLILLLSVASIKRKLLKMTYTENVASIQIQKVATFNSDRKIINLIPNK